MAKIITPTGDRSIPDYVAVRELKRQENVPANRDIVAMEVTATSLYIERLPDSEMTRPGGIYTDLPKYVRGVSNVARIRQEIQQLEAELGEDVISHDPNYSFVMLENYPLGEEYQPSVTSVLIKLPPDYPQTAPGQSAGYGIYITGGLERNGVALQCSGDQYHWECSHNPTAMRQKGWAWWCFARLEGWSSYKDGLSTILMALSETVQNPEQRNFGL